MSVDSVETTRDELGSAGIEYPLLADPDLATINAYGVRHPGGMGEGHDIARPAAFLIDQVRPRPERIFSASSAFPNLEIPPVSLQFGALI